MFKEPSSIGDANVELVLAVETCGAKHFLGTNLSGGKVGFHHQVWQRSPIQSHAPHAYLATLVGCLPHIHHLMRIVVLIMGERYHIGELVVFDERLHPDAQIDAISQCSRSKWGLATVGRELGIAIVDAGDASSMAHMTTQDVTS